MIGTRPYFMNNKDWYRFDDDEGVIVLTKDAPPEAIKSYEDFYKAIDQERNSAKSIVFSVSNESQKKTIRD